MHKPDLTRRTSLEAISGGRSATSFLLLARSTDVFQFRSHTEEDPMRVFSDVLLGYVLGFVSHWEEVGTSGLPFC
jgi:hypothetical protein